ncbi:MAG TPA: hypothetical protein VGM39_18645 [Kofleriaceae bacterium]
MIAYSPNQTAEDPRLPRVARLVRELRRWGASAESRTELTTSGVAGAFVAVFDTALSDSLLELAQTARFLERIILVGCKRPPLCFETLELGIAAGVDSIKLMAWMRPGGDNGAGMIGRRDVVAEIGGEPLGTDAFTSEHYCVYRSAAASTTVSALVEYLEALQIKLAASRA